MEFGKRPDGRRCVVRSLEALTTGTHDTNERAQYSHNHIPTITTTPSPQPSDTPPPPPLDDAVLRCDNKYCAQEIRPPVPKPSPYLNIDRDNPMPARAERNGVETTTIFSTVYKARRGRITVALENDFIIGRSSSEPIRGVYDAYLFYSKFTTCLRYFGAHCGGMATVAERFRTISGCRGGADTGSLRVDETGLAVVGPRHVGLGWARSKKRRLLPSTGTPLVAERSRS
ncbi:hypothetical protein PoB_001804100 [Plakobranchus ocellatus]|uniref:Uncharacterized protein n=1 Tax=Plakobranchus ocellatus TaxID=259542 RepID=A0AAV3YWR2_9GAST|nr:hypothetical protein PoB_001804100 [Plakobranchus ocellatus]